MKRALFLLLTLACLLLPGCAKWQMEEELLVIVLAVDETQDGNTRITVKVPSNSASGGSEQAASGGEQMGYLLLEATGNGFSDAVNMLYATTPRDLNFSQVREIVIGEKAAGRPDFPLLLQNLEALPRLRCAATVIICKGSGSAFAAAQKPYVGMRLSRYADNTLSNYANKGFTPLTSLCEGVRDLGNGFQDPLFIYGAVNDFQPAQSPREENALNALPGNLPRKSVDRVELFGAAATDGVSVSGFLTGYEMALLHLISGNAKSLNIHEAGDIPLAIFARAPATLQVDLSVRPAVLRVLLLCEVHHPPGYPPDAEAIREKITRDMEKTIAHLQALRCDGVGFGNIAVRQFGTIGAWEALGWRQVYAGARVEVLLSIQCRES